MEETTEAFRLFKAIAKDNAISSVSVVQLGLHGGGFESLHRFSNHIKSDSTGSGRHDSSRHFDERNECAGPCQNRIILGNADRTSLRRVGGPTGSFLTLGFVRKDWQATYHNYPQLLHLSSRGGCYRQYLHRFGLNDCSGCDILTS